VKRSQTFRLLPALAALLAGSSFVYAWDAAGHRTITLLALDGLPADAPAFLREANTRMMVASQACEPDRWRAVTIPELTHINNPDHYINLETLTKVGLDFATLPRLRIEYTDLMAVARASHPEAFEALNAKKDPGRANMTAGTLPYAIVENYAKLQGAFKTLRVLETLDEPVRASQIAQAQANIVAIMGVLSHFVGDAAQPLHTTIHHHGWVGDNPNQYTTRYSFHAEIDGGVLERHTLNYNTLKPGELFNVHVDAANPAADVRTYIDRSFSRVEPLYKLEVEKKLLGEEGKTFIAERLHDASSTLAALYSAAWTSSEPSAEEVRKFVFYDKFDGAATIPTRFVAPATAPASRPAAESAPGTALEPEPVLAPRR